MAKNDVYTEFIINKIKSGIVEPKHIISEFCTNFHKTERTFWNQWKIAEKKHTDSENLIKKEFEDKYKHDVHEGLKLALNRKKHKQDILKKIIDGELLVEKVVIVRGEIKTIMAKPDAQDIMKAIDIDNKMEGDYAPTKSQVELNNGASDIFVEK